MGHEGSDALFRWLLDTRKWVVEVHPDSQYQRALHKITADEQKAVGKYLHDKDRLMSLGSHLLKYSAISTVCGTSWSDISIGRDEFGKPIYVTSPLPHNASTLPSSLNSTSSNPVPSARPIQFNVSHQAGLVALVGIPSSSVRVGIDIVCVDERDDYKSIQRRGGMAEWVSMYDEVFSAGEISDMKRCACGVDLDLDLASEDSTGTGTAPGTVPETQTHVSADELAPVIQDGARPLRPNTEVTLRLHSGRIVTFNANLIIDAQLRLFYAHWCLKEAYIKMTGEALLAGWLKELEFRNVRPPKPAGPRAIEAQLVGLGGIQAQSVGLGGSLGQPHGQSQSQPNDRNLGLGHDQPKGHADPRWGTTVTDFDTVFRGQKVPNLRIDLTAFEQQYMIATAVLEAGPSEDFQGGDDKFPDFKDINLERDVFPLSG
ncbi:4'-phosphopantetheinyl transferase [Xylona heveae TC161]|uniref:holo-[acyl-carrier-protein] synthase n=1 Tax=Xylona heveae (strain CBS 132557 / TC161) TaxID=1328760 RepID=A0A165FY03_XYLHT|nr:4'-phosphopantetheinyl transferase [Xylona heveae TC161]KZF21519.1 4'-phosphopantetheinyl transferase [Xylona heveae TC161]